MKTFLIMFFLAVPLIARDPFKFGCLSGKVQKNDEKVIVQQAQLPDKKKELVSAGNNDEKQIIYQDDHQRITRLPGGTITKQLFPR